MQMRCDFVRRPTENACDQTIVAEPLFFNVGTLAKFECPDTTVSWRVWAFFGWGSTWCKSRRLGHRTREPNRIHDRRRWFANATCSMILRGTVFSNRLRFAWRFCRWSAPSVEPTDGCECRRETQARRRPEPSRRWRTKISDSLAMAFDLVGDRPQGRMISKMSSTGTVVIFFALRARRKSLGVTWLTRSSVHWALNKTATNKVKGFEWSNGIGGFGYSSAKRCITKAARSAFFITVFNEKA